MIQLTGGSRINHIFHSTFSNTVNAIDPFEYLSEVQIQTAIKNASAMAPSLFVPESAFEVLVRQQIARLLEPSLDCTYQVYEELRRIVIGIELPGLTRYYKLKSRICDVMENVLDKCLTPTTDMIMNLFEIENANINTNHPDFVGSADSLLNLFQEEDAEGGAGDAADPDGGPTDKNFGLLKKKPQEVDIDDFHDVQQEDGAEESKEETKGPSGEAKPAQRQQSINGDGREDH